MGVWKARRKVSVEAWEVAECNTRQIMYGFLATC